MQVRPWDSGGFFSFFAVSTANVITFINVSYHNNSKETEANERRTQSEMVRKVGPLIFFRRQVIALSITGCSHGYEDKVKSDLAPWRCNNDKKTLTCDSDLSTCAKLLAQTANISAVLMR